MPCRLYSRWKWSKSIVVVNSSRGSVSVIVEEASQAADKWFSPGVYPGGEEGVRPLDVPGFGAVALSLAPLAGADNY